MTRIDGIDIHFLHVQGSGPKPTPLLLSHGWPGSVLEFMKLIPLLTDPAAHGGDAADAFTRRRALAAGLHAVVPPRPAAPRRWPRSARCSTTLMTSASATRATARRAATGVRSSPRGWARTAREHLIGIHLNLMPIRRDAAMFTNPTRTSARYLDELEAWLKEETGYQAIQGTRPQTLAFGLSDSPVGLAAWIVEKYRAWTDCDGDPRNALSMDEMLGNISLYWFTNCIGASFWPYYARMHGPWPIDGKHRRADRLLRVSARDPAPAARGGRAHVRRHPALDVMPKGGHFAALEQPEALAAEIEGFFASLG